MSEAADLTKLLNDPRNGDAVIFSQLTPLTLVAIERCSDTNELNALGKAVKKCHAAANKRLFMAEGSGD